MGRDSTPEVEKPAEGTGDASGKLSAEMAAERQVAAATRGEQDLKPGVVKSKDGSEVEHKQTADGKVHPVGIKYSNGEGSQYEYDKSGTVSQITNLRADGTVKDRWMSTDGGKTYREERSGEVKELAVKVNNDGTVRMTDKAGNTFDSRTDGSILMNFKDAQGNAHKVVSRSDGSAIEYGTFSDGKERPINVRSPDGSTVNYGYLKNGSVVDATTYAPNGQLVNRYECRDGANWVEVSNPPRGPNFNGKVEIRPDGTHHFTDARTGGTWVRKPSGQITITDGQGRVVSETPPIPPPRR